ncbi:unnamed protein product, partial [Ectocarpus sp. 8 AP-2014]
PLPSPLLLSLQPLLFRGPSNFAHGPGGARLKLGVHLQHFLPQLGRQGGERVHPPGLHVQPAHAPGTVPGRALAVTRVGHQPSGGAAATPPRRRGRGRGRS